MGRGRKRRVVENRQRLGSACCLATNSQTPRIKYEAGGRVIFPNIAFELKALELQTDIPSSRLSLPAGNITRR